MRILQVHNRHREPGGEDAAVAADRAILAGGGHTVAAFEVTNPDDPVAAARTLVKSPWNAAAARRLGAEIDRFGADVVHVHNTWFALSAAVVHAAAARRVPVVVTLHNFRTVCLNGLLLREGAECTLCVGTHPLAGVRHRCYRTSAALSTLAAAAVVVPRRRGTWRRDVDRFIVLDPSMRSAVVAGGIPEDLVEERPNAIVDPGVRTSRPSASPTVVFAGRLSAEKGVAVLLEAWSRARPRGLRLVVCGDGPERAALEARRSEGVEFAGRLPRAEVLAAVRGARALVFPSVWREAGPLVPLEAAASGTPVLVSDRVGFAAALRDAGAGWVSAAGDPDALAQDLTALAEGSVDVDGAGRAARSLFERRHGEAAGLASLEAVYENAALHHRDRSINSAQSRRQSPEPA